MLGSPDLRMKGLSEIITFLANVSRFTRIHESFSGEEMGEAVQSANKGEALVFSGLIKPEQLCFSQFCVLWFYVIFSLK